MNKTDEDFLIKTELLKIQQQLEKLNELSDRKFVIEERKK